jgi:putative endonuclease
MDTKELGNLGEKLACEYLVKNGFKILGKNWRINFGEIDIIAKKDKTIHFVEVKTIFASSGFAPEDHVDYRKQRKLMNLAQIWLEKNRYPQDIPYQIDIVGISANQQTRMAKLHYFPNAVGG